MIGIIGAMDEEVAQIVEVMQVERKESKAFPCSLTNNKFSYSVYNTSKSTTIQPANKINIGYKSCITLTSYAYRRLHSSLLYIV